MGQPAHHTETEIRRSTMLRTAFCPVVREALDARAEALRIARDRAEVGYTSQLELRQAEAEYRAAQQQIAVFL